MTGDEIKALRVAAGLSVRAAAKLLEVNATTLTRWQRCPHERSDIRYWQVELLRKIAAQRQEGQ